MATFANLDSAEDQLHEAGLPAAQIADLTDAARDALVFTRQVQPEDETEIGASKLGGAPDLPENMDWPTRPPYPHAPEMLEQLSLTYGPGGYVANALLMAFYTGHLKTPQPLAFLGQFNLSNLREIGPFDIGLPAHGRLLLFVDVASFSSGASHRDAGWLEVIHDRTEVADLARRAPPPEIFDTMRARENAEVGRDLGTPRDLSQCEALTPHAAITLPMDAQRLPLDARRALRELHLADFLPLMGGLGPDAPIFFGDQLGGHPHPIQNNVERDLFAVVEPILRPVTQAEQQGRWDPMRWAHLFSIAGESYLSAFPSTWGDGDLYVQHRPDPAAPDALGQVWAISQRT
ncbi:DUF1963 domain-containing protein [Hasllibacter sp. MH4015]|uniref:DUF1963 domain-containing protein n=1 Tax=Hasllibacter sp. MH4015 TaxID=2854029 RepID=UPI001CD7363B|nr:DUF1963 domain-containing protein [Hasllibacter sp. MH4015]